MVKLGGTAGAYCACPFQRDERFLLLSEKEGDGFMIEDWCGLMK